MLFFRPCIFKVVLPTENLYVLWALLSTVRSLFLVFFSKGGFSDVVCHWTCSSCDGIEMCSFCLEILGVNSAFVEEFSQSCSQLPAFSQNWVCSLSWWHFPSRTVSVVLSLLKGPWAIFRGNFTLHLLSFGYWCSKIVLNCSFPLLSKILKWVWDPLFFMLPHLQTLDDVPL